MNEPFVRLAAWLAAEAGRTVFVGETYPGTDLPRVCVLSGWAGHLPIEGYEHVAQRFDVEAVAISAGSPYYHARPATERRVVLDASASESDLVAAALGRWSELHPEGKTP